MAFFSLAETKASETHLINYRNSREKTEHATHLPNVPRRGEVFLSPNWKRKRNQFGAFNVSKRIRALQSPKEENRMKIASRNNGMAFESDLGADRIEQ